VGERVLAVSNGTAAGRRWWRWRVGPTRSEPGRPEAVGKAASVVWAGPAG